MLETIGFVIIFFFFFCCREPQALKHILEKRNFDKKEN